jgi:hypothetical protein
MSAEFPLEKLQQRFFVFGWGVRRRPQVPIRRVKYRNRVLVNDSKCPPVPDTVVTVTFHQGSDGVGAAELLGQQDQAGCGDQHPPAGLGFDEIPAPRVSRAS